MSPEWAKILTMASLGFGSLIVGLLPAAFTNYNLRRNPLLLTFLLCFGGGILMATSLVHILAEVSETLGHGYAEVVFCLGFMLVYFADEMLHFCCGEAIQHGHSHSDEERQLIFPENRQQQNITYGTTKSQESCEQHQHQHDIEDEIVNERICHTNHSEPCRQTFAGIIGMLTALSIHSIIEGLAIGIQKTSAEVMILFTAVLSHKFVVGFCLGVELSISPGATFKRHFIAIFVFSAGSVLGIGIGMGLVDLSTVVDSKVLAILQGVAGGTLLYVTVSEILPREKAKWHQNQINRAVGLLQLLAFGIGFALMTVMIFYITEDE